MLRRCAHFASILHVLLLIVTAHDRVSATTAGDSLFTLPEDFLGTWNGEPTFNIMGPYSSDSYTFTISKTERGDYLFANNIIYDEQSIGYQRFYVEGYGETAGNLWYCGNISHYFDGYGVTGTGRENGFKAVAQTDNSVTFCLDSDNPKVMAGYNNPFKPLCSLCECSNWTLSYDAGTQQLSTQLSMGAADGETHSKHLWAALSKTGPAPAVNDTDMPAHGEDFSCDFSEGGRDNGPIVEVTDDHLSLSDTASSASCPFFKHQQVKDSKKVIESGHVGGRSDVAAASEYDHCYILNELTDYRLEWTLDNENGVLNCRVSIPSTSTSTTSTVEERAASDAGDSAINKNQYIAIGFRPLSRSGDVSAVSEGTGHHMDFGMEGADIVAASINAGVRTLYAAQYTGPPVVDYSLKLLQSEIQLANDGDSNGSRLSLSFTRPLVGGFLAANFNSTASIVSQEADIIWAIGLDASSSSSTAAATRTAADGGDDGNPSTCDYHSNNRGLRFVDWEHPAIAMYDAWKC